MLNPNGGQRWTINDLTAYGKAQQQQKANTLQQGGFDALFRGAQPVQGMGSMEELLGSGNQFFNPFGTATPYSADQVRTMQNSMPMSIGETSRVLYKGQVYDNPMGGQMAAWNAMTPQQRNQMVQQIQGAGAGTWREQDYMAGGGTPVPQFGQLGANTGMPAQQQPQMAPQSQPQQSPQQMPQQSPQALQAALAQLLSGAGMRGGGLLGYGAQPSAAQGMVPGGFGGYGSRVVRY